MNNEELKRERFIKIAENRTNKIITTLKLLGNCSNKNNYNYTQEDVRAIFNAIDAELRNTKSKFNKHEKSKFSLRKETNNE